MSIQQPAEGTGQLSRSREPTRSTTRTRRAAAETEVAAYDADESRAPTAEVDARRTQEIDSAEVGVVGMAVMGSSLARNMARHEYRVALFNRTYGRTQQVVSR
jgi:6-phosphogluconate dehydrogenase